MGAVSLMLVGGKNIDVSWLKEKNGRLGDFWGVPYCSDVPSVILDPVWGAACDTACPGSGVLGPLWVGGLSFPPSWVSGPRMMQIEQGYRLVAHLYVAVQGGSQQLLECSMGCAEDWSRPYFMEAP